MGVKRLSRHGSGSMELSDVQQGSSSDAANAKVLERQTSRRKASEKSILDDIMGDPDDFKELLDPEEEGGRWEDTIREALKSEGDAKGVKEAAREEIQLRRKNSIEMSEPERLHGANGHQREEAKKVVASTRHKTHGTRYFIIKSLNHHNLTKSIERGIWATQAMNEAVLNEAFESSERVLLVFSVNMSGHFQGYAQMTSPIGRRRANLWNDANDGTNPWGGMFAVEWLRLFDLPFQQTSHLKNPLNHFKPVKISRDCQELPQELGEALCALIDEGADREGNPKRKAGAVDGAGTKRIRGETEPFADGAYRHPLGMDGSMLMMYPPLTGMHSHEPPVGLQNKPGFRKSPQKSQSHEPEKEKEKEKEKDRDKEKDSEKEKRREKERDREKERERERRREKDKAVKRDTDKEHRKSLDNRKAEPPEEELLNMTYEEYLQRHGNVHQQFHGPSVPAFGGPWMGPGTAFPEDQYSNYLANWYGNRGRGEAFYGGVPPYGGVHPHDPNWHGPPIR